MIKKMLKWLVGMILLLVLTIGVLGLIGLMGEKSKSMFTHEEVDQISPVLVIDDYTLLSEDTHELAIKQLESRLFKIGVLVVTPLGIFINPTLHGYHLPIIIQSGGGNVELGLDVVNSLNSLRKLGILIKCHVGEAQSMAFHIMITSCDRVVAKKSSILMQHRISYRSSGQTPSTYLSDLELSKAEAEVLGVDYKVWHKVARGEEDHIFTKQEIEKYKLVDEWVD